MSIENVGKRRETEKNEDGIGQNENNGIVFIMNERKTKEKRF